MLRLGSPSSTRRTIGGGDSASVAGLGLRFGCAAYYAAQPKRNPNPATLAESPPPIVRLVELGDPSRNIPPCASCHRPGSGGPIETPILAEQAREYLVRQLQLYASGERRNDVYGRMRIIAAQLTPGEIDGLAAYYRAGFR